MIRKVINIDNYWKVIVYYNINYNLFSYIAEDLLAINSPVERIDAIYFNLRYKAKAVTVSSFKYRTSIVAFNIHKTFNDYLNSIVHEAEHVKQAMLKYYRIKDKGEPPAYTIGYLAMKMLGIKVMKNLKYKKS